MAFNAGSFFSCRRMYGILELDQHLLGIGHEIGREIAAIELHALDDFEIGIEALGFLDRNDAFISDFLHRLGNQFTDLTVVIGRDGADLRDLRVGRNLFRSQLDILDHHVDGHVDAALEVHRVHAGRDRLGAFAYNRLRQDSGRGGAVAGEIAGAGGNLLDHLRAHVLELVGKLDFLGNRDTVLGDAGRSIGLVEDDIASFGAQASP